MRKRQDRHSQRECKKVELQIPPETRHVVAMDATQHVTYVGCLFFAFRRRTGRKRLSSIQTGQARTHCVCVTTGEDARD